MDESHGTWVPTTTAAAQAHVSRRTLFRWLKNGMVPSRIVDGRRMVDAEAMDVIARVMRRRRDGNAAEPAPTPVTTPPSFTPEGGERVQELSEVVTLLLEQVEAIESRLLHVERCAGLR